MTCVCVCVCRILYILGPPRYQLMDSKIALSAAMNNFNVVWKGRKGCLIVVDTKEKPSRDAVLGSLTLKHTSL